MPTKEISRDQWIDFFDSFSQRHKGWLVKIEVLNLELGDQLKASDLALESITAEIDENGEEKILVNVGEEPDSRISHTIAAPGKVWLKQTEEGADEAIDIESETGAMIVSFRSAVLPELVDSLA
jgi:hypothetical protein